MNLYFTIPLFVGFLKEKSLHTW